jgi:hypothetical protein
MSKELNYSRCWNEYLKPEFEKMFGKIIRDKKCLRLAKSTPNRKEYENLRSALNITLRHVHTMTQDGASHALNGVTEITKILFDKVPVEQLAIASQLVYYYGHFAPSKSAIQDGGAYWKFQILADRAVIDKGRSFDLAHDAQIAINAKIEEYNDHKEGTEYDNEEGAEILTALTKDISKTFLSIEKIDTVNHKPDMFCIGPQHLTGDSIYLDPTVAPCAHCGQPYSAHTYDTAMFVKLLRDPKESKEVEDMIRYLLKKILDYAIEHRIKLDGFAMVKGF